MAKNANAAKKLDKEIDRLYRALAQGRQIDIMKIGTLFAYCRAEVEKGTDLESAVRRALEIFTEPS